MIIKQFQFNPFPVNTFVIHDEKTKECAIIDPGCYWDEERDELERYIHDNSLRPKYLLLTHLHLDHSLSIPFVKRTFNIPFCANKKDAFLLDNAEQKALSYGFRLLEKMVPIDKEIHEGDIFYLGEQEIHCLEVPGHSPGSIVFYLPANHTAIVGDVLFRESIGRTDLPGGDYQTLIDNIEQKLMVLPDNTTIYPGHGLSTTIGYETINNPYIK